jgi:glycosyltransferase involved in cell wall biosynthesis
MMGASTRRRRSPCSGGVRLSSDILPGERADALNRTDRNPMPQAFISVLIPVLNEAENIAALLARTTATLDACNVRYEIVFVDDGSQDATLARLREAHARDPRVRAVALSRNFGKEIAIAAGLAHVRGDAAIIMDADLQHPPEVIAEFLARWRDGYQVVYGQRLARDTDSALRRTLARSFYRIFNALVRTDIPEGAGDFRLLDRKAIDAMNAISETSRFNKGLFSWIGFKSIGVPYRVAERSAGATKWSVTRLLKFAIDGLTSFSTLPLRVSTLLGLLVSFIAFAYVMVFIVKTMLFGTDVPGFPTIVISVMFFSGVQLVFLGIIGEYLGRVYEEVKARPLYLVAEEIGVEQPPPRPARQRLVDHPMDGRT